MVSCKDEFHSQSEGEMQTVRVILMLNNSLLTAVVGWLFHAKAISGVIYSPPSIKTAHYTLNMTLRIQAESHFTSHCTLNQSSYR